MKLNGEMVYLSRAVDYEGEMDAIAGARDLVANNILAGRPVYRSHRIEITDEGGNLLDTVLFGDVLDLRP